jgi:hypothetical protein
LKKASASIKQDLPDEFYNTSLEEEEEEQEEEDDLSTDREDSTDIGQDDIYVEVDGQRRKIPRIPRRVAAPIETAWIDNKLTVAFEPTRSSLSEEAIQANIESFKIELSEFIRDLRNTDLPLSFSSMRS